MKKLLIITIIFLLNLPAIADDIATNTFIIDSDTTASIAISGTLTATIASNGTLSNGLNLNYSISTNQALNDIRIRALVAYGTGIASEQKSVSVKLPPEVKDGQKIRLKGEGKKDNHGNKGDLYLKILIKDSEYQVDGVNLTKEVEVTPSQAVLGCKKDIKTLHGNIGIKIPSGTSTGTLRLKNLGLPKKEGGYGDLNAKIKIILPKKLSDKQVDLYKKLAELD